LQAGGDGFDPRVVHCAPVAQLVEHFLGKEEVAGSIPAVGSEGRVLAHGTVSKTILAEFDPLSPCHGAEFGEQT
jgi:hypothetical protein